MSMDTDTTNEFEVLVFDALELEMAFFAEMKEETTM